MMFDFQSIEAMVPPKSTWLPGTRVMDGHRLSMIENEDGSLTIVDELVGAERHKPMGPISDQLPIVDVVTYGDVGWGRTWGGGRRTVAACIDPLMARQSASGSTQTPLDRRLSDASRRKYR